jgi:hypothetical protein
MKTQVITGTGRSIRLITVVPEKRPPDWSDYYGVCGLDSEDQTFCHPHLCDIQDDVWDTSTVYLIRIGKCFCPLVSFKWAKEHSSHLVAEIEILEQRVRQAINRGDGEIQPLLVFETPQSKTHDNDI